MTDLALIRARDAELPAYKLMPRCGTHAFADRRALLALVDELQRERDEYLIKLGSEMGRYDGLRTALLEAGPAIEAGAKALDLAVSNDKDSWLLKLNQIKQLRALMGLVG